MLWKLSKSLRIIPLIIIIISIIVIIIGTIPLKINEKNIPEFNENHIPYEEQQ